jgi:Leucine-rich repeat (LRR) protein
MTQLRILNLSNNPGLSSDSIKRVLQILRQHQITKLEELNLSKLPFSGNEEAFKELSMFLTSSKSLKTLSLMRVGLDDAMAFYLIEALAKAPKLTTLKLDFNRVTGVFVDRYTSKLQQCGYTPSASLGM